MRYTFVMLAMYSMVLVGCGTKPADQTTNADSTESNDAESSDTKSSDGQAAGFVLSGQNTQVLFTGTKQSGDNHSGGFKSLSGKITLSDGSVGGINVVIETDSLFSDADRLTGHLKSEDFFSVPEFPELNFESTKIEGAGDVTVTGNLTMHGQTNEISFPATIDVADGNVTLNSEFKVDRTKFGMNFTGKPDDPINAEVDIKIIVGAGGGSSDEAASASE